MTKTTNGYTFECSGRGFYSNGHIIGINPNLEVYEGYDGTIEHAGNPPDWWLATTEPFYVNEREYYFTKEEKRELAEYMINLWQQYKERMT